MVQVTWAIAEDWRMWRDGTCLVIGIGEAFPDRCVKSNRPAHGRRVPQVVEQGNLLLFGIHLLNPLAAVVADRLVIRRVTLSVPLSDGWRRKRRRAFCLAGGIIVVSLAAMAYGVTLIGQRDIAFWLVPVGLLSTLGGLVYGLNASTLVTAKRITANYVWLRGVHRDFLADLPQWPGEWWADSLESPGM